MFNKWFRFFLLGVCRDGVFYLLEIEYVLIKGGGGGVVYLF